MHPPSVEVNLEPEQTLSDPLDDVVLLCKPWSKWLAQNEVMTLSTTRILWCLRCRFAWSAWLSLLAKRTSLARVQSP